MSSRKYVCIIILHSVVLFLATAASAQHSAKKKFKELSPPEKTWVIFHPFVAKKALKLSELARAESKALISDPRLDGDENGGQIDAFRHAYWMTLLSQHMCWRKARSLGVAHEKGNYINWKKNRLEDMALTDSIASVMDMKNNSYGINLSRQSGKINVDTLKTVIINAILEGELIILWKNKEGKFLDCDGILADDQIRLEKWSKSRCLVPSNKGRKKDN